MNRRKGMAAVVGLALLLGAAAAAAEEGTSRKTEGSLRKLGRGLANIVTCPAELFETPQRVAAREGWLAGGTVGVLQGAWRTLLRGLIGVFEVGTFYAEIPEGYGPLIRPEFAFGHETWEGIDD
jgi:putative exosortase-associated protein (TIGR04073 family)